VWLANPTFWLASYYFWRGETKTAATLAGLGVAFALSWWFWIDWQKAHWRELPSFLLPYWIWLGSLLLFFILAWLASAGRGKNRGVELPSPGDGSAPPK
jgi:hypothetical protein